MKRTVLALGMVLALAMTTMAAENLTGSGPEITSPTAGEVAYQDMLHLEADAHRSGGTISWAVRSSVGPDCPEPAGTLRLERKLGVPSVDGQFSETLDISGVPAGKYCFAFQADADAAASLPAVRVVQHFYIVDDYIMVDASIDEALDAYDPDRGKPDYSVSGVIGLYGTDSATGMLEVRYHDPKITCWIDVSTGDWRTGDTGFDTDSIPDFAGVDSADYTCNNGDYGTFGSVFFLDPATTTAVPEWPGGAVVIDEDGVRTTSDKYDLIGELDTSYYWVPLDRGEAYFNIW